MSTLKGIQVVTEPAAPFGTAARSGEKYRTPQDYLKVPEEELQKDIQSTGFFRQKTRALRGMSQTLIAVALPLGSARLLWPGSDGLADVPEEVH